MNIIKTYNQEITLSLFCVGIIFYGIGGSISKIFNAQTFFHIGGFIFLLCNYKKISWADLKHIKLPLICFAIVLFLGFCTLFDIITPNTLSQMFKKINSHILGLFVLFFILFFYVLHTSQKKVNILLLCFALMCGVDVVATIYVWVSNDFQSHIEPLFFFHIIALNVWLLGASAICVAGVATMQSIKIKILCAIGLFLCFMAILGNGERSFLLGFIAVLLSPFFIWTYKYKKYVLFILLLIGIPSIYGIYTYSATLSDRYNFKHMIDNVSTIWQSPPIEMGQYDAYCFDDTQEWLECSSQSLALGKNEITLEHSALTRLAMYKSALHIIANEPFKPHIAGATSVGEYLKAYYDKDNPYRIYINSSVYGKADNIYGFGHIHSTSFSLMMEYGILGFLAVIVFQFYIWQQALTISNKDNAPAQLRFVSKCVSIFLIGLWVQVQFDVMHPVMLKTFFLFFGLYLALVHRYINENPTNNR
ncbi:hypothetical protein T36_0122 [Helicobacter cinaedi]|uniref:O-antigen ligase family protein n=1 Tax=Helicobacter cinaedi TaxID=213 RepID=UPI001F383977|nr:O-antigen ligase family protein [Helicobacter cinaedi]BDB63683.1 hypothetical protein T36_0122 [Helicobacter cinaedi]